MRPSLLIILLGVAFNIGAKDSPIHQSGIQVPDYSYAGYAFGEREWSAKEAHTILVEEFGAIPNDDIDDSAALLKAMAAAHDQYGPVRVQLQAGRYILSDILDISRSNFTLQGMGMGEGGTELYIPRPLRMLPDQARFKEIARYLESESKMQVEPQNNVNLPFSHYSWTGGFIWVGLPESRPFDYLKDFDAKRPSQEWPIKSAAQGRLQLALSEPPKSFRVGQKVRIIWRNSQGQDGSLVDQIYGTKRDQLITPVGSRLWEDPKRAVVTQISEIKAISGNTLTLASSMMHPVNRSLPATLSAWEGLEEVVLRDFAMRFASGESFGHHLEEGFNGIHLTDVYNGMLASLRFIDPDSGVLTYNAAAITIQDVQTTGEREAHYSVHLGNVHGVLVRDLQVLNRTLHALSFNTYCTRSVYQRAQVWRDGVIDQHAGINHQNLVDQASFFVHAKRDETGQAYYPLWDGSGAGYWQPGHGRYNTHWNVTVQVLSGANPDEVVRLTGKDEGPEARIIGVSSNRALDVLYRPAPYLQQIGLKPDVPSLFDWQRARRAEKLP